MIGNFAKGKNSNCLKPNNHSAHMQYYAGGDIKKELQIIMKYGSKRSLLD